LFFFRHIVEVYQLIHSRLSMCSDNRPHESRNILAFEYQQ